MKSLHEKLFIFSQGTFLESKKFVLPQITVEITIQLHKDSDKASNEYFVSLSHFIKTPSQNPVPPVNHLNQTLVSGADNDNAFATIKKSFFHAYEEAMKGGLMPDNSWLIPNIEFVDFNNTKVR